MIEDDQFGAWQTLRQRMHVLLAQENRAGVAVSCLGRIETQCRGVRIGANLRCAALRAPDQTSIHGSTPPFRLSQILQIRRLLSTAFRRPRTGVNFNLIEHSVALTPLAVRARNPYFAAGAISWLSVEHSSSICTSQTR